MGLRCAVEGTGLYGLAQRVGRLGDHLHAGLDHTETFGVSWGVPRIVDEPQKGLYDSWGAAKKNLDARGKMTQGCQTPPHLTWDPGFDAEGATSAHDRGSLVLHGDVGAASSAHRTRQWVQPGSESLSAMGRAPHPTMEGSVGVMHCWKHS